MAHKIITIRYLEYYLGNYMKLWNSNEIDFLIKNINKYSNLEFANLLNRTEKSIALEVSFKEL